MARYSPCKMEFPPKIERFFGKEKRKLLDEPLDLGDARKTSFWFPNSRRTKKREPRGIFDPLRKTSF